MTSLFSIHNILHHFNLGSGYDLSYVEAVGTIFGLLCFVYAGRERRVNFVFGSINAILFAVIFYQLQLYANLFLQGFFLILNIYGLYAWGKANPKQQALTIRWLTLKGLVVSTVSTIILILILTKYIDELFNCLTLILLKGMRYIGINLTMPAMQVDPNPLMDAVVTVLSVVAMLLMARKYLENWWLWIAVGITSTVLYAQQGVYFMALEYIVVTFISGHGLILWLRYSKVNGVK